MQTHFRPVAAGILGLGLSWVSGAQAECSAPALTDPALSIATPRAVRFSTDITKRATARIADSAFEIKVRRTVPGAQGFNNEPRYELAAFRLQQFLVGEGAEVVPPTAVRSLALPEFQLLDDVAAETFRGTGAVLFVVQCWLDGAAPHADAIDLQRFAADARYARAISNVNVLTYLIEHKDSNRGNVMLTEGEAGPRAWAIDNGVAFASAESDRGTFWRDLHVPAIERPLYDKLRATTRPELESLLGVVAEFTLAEGKWVPVAHGEVYNWNRGVRRKETAVQLGLTRNEIRNVHRRFERLVDQVERGNLALLPES